MSKSDLKDLSIKRLDAEFDRLADLKDAAEASMREIREEKARRKDEEAADLRAQISAKSGGAE